MSRRAITLKENKDWYESKYDLQTLIILLGLSGFNIILFTCALLSTGEHRTLFLVLLIVGGILPFLGEILWNVFVLMKINEQTRKLSETKVEYYI